MCEKRQLNLSLFLKANDFFSFIVVRTSLNRIFVWEGFDKDNCLILFKWQCSLIFLWFSFRVRLLLAFLIAWRIFSFRLRRLAVIWIRFLFGIFRFDNRGDWLNFTAVLRWWRFGRSLIIGKITYHKSSICWSFSWNCIARCWVSLRINCRNNRIGSYDCSCITGRICDISDLSVSGCGGLKGDRGEDNAGCSMVSEIKKN